MGDGGPATEEAEVSVTGRATGAEYFVATAPTLSGSDAT